MNTTPVIETANINGRRVLCVRVRSGLTARLDAVTFRDRPRAEAKRDELRAQGVACETVRGGKLTYIALT